MFIGAKASTDYHRQSQENYEAALKTLTCPAVPEEFKGLSSVQSAASVACSELFGLFQSSFCFNISKLSVKMG